MKKTVLLIAATALAIFAQTKDMIIYHRGYGSRYDMAQTDSVTFPEQKDILIFSEGKMYGYDIANTDSIAFEDVPGGTFIVKYLDETGAAVPGLATDTIAAKLNVNTTIQGKPTADYYRISSGQITDLITENGQTKEIVFKYEKIQDEDKYSYISIVYTNTTKPITENAELKFYVTDYEQSDYIDEDYSKKFDIALMLNGEKREFKDLTIGNVTLDLGKLPEGEYIYTVQATDKSNGRKTQELYGEFRVLDFAKEQQDIAAKTYVMTEADLVVYNIKNNDDATNALATKNGIKKLISEKSGAGIRKLVMLPGIYTIDVEEIVKVHPQAGRKFYEPTNIIEIPSNFTLDLNGSTLKMKKTPIEQVAGTMIVMNNAHNAHLVNGTLYGDNWEKDLENIPNAQDSHGKNYGEHLEAGGIRGASKYCSWENLTVKNFSGYAVTTGISHTTDQAIWGDFPQWTAGAIDENGEIVPRRNKYSSQLIDLSVKKNDATHNLTDVNTFRIGKYLGYQWNPNGREWALDIAFYDADKKLIEKKIVNQYRDMLKPSNAQYIRFSYVAVSPEELNEIILHHGYFPKNSTFRNIAFDDNRTCGLAPFQGNNLLIEGCKFSNTGRRVTPAAVDFEDGWYNMQDYCMRNNEVLIPTGTTDIVVVGGENLQFINNKNFKFTTNYFTVGTLIEDNEDLNLNLYITNRVYSGYSRIQRNSFKAKTHPGNSNEELTFNRTLPLIYKDCTIFEKGAGSSHPLDKFVRCSFDFNSIDVTQNFGGIMKGVFEDCTIKNYTSNYVMGIADATFNNCTFINNRNMILQGNVKFINSTIDGFEIKNWNHRNISLRFENCDIKEFYLNKTTMITQIELELNNCTIANSSRPNIVNDAYRNLNRADEYLNITTSGNTLNGSTGFVTETLKNADNPYINLSNMK